MSESTGILVILAAIGCGYIAADLTPDLRGVGVATFAAVALLLVGLHRFARWMGAK